MKVFGLLRFNAALAALALIGGSLCAAPVFAQSTGILSFSSEPGDYIGQGRTLTFSSGVTATASSDNRIVGVNVNNSEHWFYLDLAAPAGQQLQPGVYDNATRYPFQADNVPGLSFYGDGSGCNQDFGKFTVIEAKFGPFGYIEKLHVTFEQHCESPTAPGLFGEVVISNPPPPPALTIKLVFDAQAAVKRVNGQATVGGTVTCSVATTTNINGNLVQRAGRFNIANGSFAATSACSPTPTHWTAPAVSYGTPFNAGTAQIDGTANAFDPNYSSYVSDTGSAVVNLVGAKK